MGAIVSLLVTLTFAVVSTRVATTMLVHTGLSHEAARFQARSAFTGVGFTTGESETVMNHPVRRNIMMGLMFVGNIGFITVLSTSVLTFLEFDRSRPLEAVLLLVSGLTVLVLLARSRWVDRHLSRVISVLISRYTTLDTRDYASLLQLSGDYRVLDLLVQEGDWLSERSLKELRLRDEGVMVLGITRADGSYVGAPRGNTRVQVGDNLILYGKSAMCERLDERRLGRSGEAEHLAAVEEQRRELAEQERQEAERETAQEEPQP